MKALIEFKKGTNQYDDDEYLTVVGTEEQLNSADMCIEGLRALFMVPKRVKRVWLGITDEPTKGFDAARLNYLGYVTFEDKDKAYILDDLRAYMRREYGITARTQYYVKVWYT